MTLDRWARYVVMTLVTGLVCACGGASRESVPPAPYGAGEAEPSDDELELSRAELLLGIAPHQSKPTLVDGATPQPGVSPEPPPSVAGTPLSSEPATCETACSALASMVRAAGRICDLSGPGDRCTRAQSRVARAKTHVESTCGSCS